MNWLEIVGFFIVLALVGILTMTAIGWLKWWDK